MKETILKTYTSKVVYFTDEQREQFDVMRDALRLVWNTAIEIEERAMKNGKEFINPNDLDWYFRNVISKKYHQEYVNIARCSARQHLLLDLHTAYKNFFMGKTCKPKFKSYKNPIKSIYFSNISLRIISSNCVNIPYFKKVRIQRKIELPKNAKLMSGRLTAVNDKDIYLHILVELPKPKALKPISPPIGIDLGIRKLATFNRPILDISFTCGNESIISYPKLININQRISHLENRIRRLQRVYSKKINFNKTKHIDELNALTKSKDRMNPIEYKNRMRSIWIATYRTENIKKLIYKINKCFGSIVNIRKDYELKIISSIIANRPTYIAIEDIDIQKMINDTSIPNIRKAIYMARWYSFRIHLQNKCREHGIELRIVDRKYKSSQICSSCGNFYDISLDDTQYRCPKCGLIIDRDVNAAINLINADKYEVYQ